MIISPFLVISSPKCWSLHSATTGGYFQCNRFVEDAFSEKSDRKRSDGNAHEGVFYSLNITQSIITIENTFKSMKDTRIFKKYPYKPYFLCL
jgi:hypothetical protein